MTTEPNVLLCFEKNASGQAVVYLLNSSKDNLVCMDALILHKLLRYLQGAKVDIHDNLVNFVINNNDFKELNFFIDN